MSQEENNESIPKEVIKKPKKILTQSQIDGLAKGRAKAHARMKGLKLEKQRLNDLENIPQVLEEYKKPEITSEQKPQKIVKKPTSLELKKIELEKLRLQQEEDDMDEQIELLKKPKEKKQKVIEKEFIEQKVIEIPKEKKRNFMYC